MKKNIYIRRMIITLLAIAITTAFVPYIGGQSVHAASTAQITNLKAYADISQAGLQTDLAASGYRFVKLAWKSSVTTPKYVIYYYKKGVGYKRLVTVSTNSAQLLLPKRVTFIKVRSYDSGTYGPLSTWVSVKAGTVNASAVTYSKTFSKVTVGNKVRFYAAANGNVTRSVRWSVSNSNATITRYGTLTAKKAGYVYVTATAHNGMYKRTKVALVSKYPATVTISGQSSQTVGLGSANNLKVTLSPAVYNTVTWTSSDTSVATVNSTGTVTAVSTGTATITCTAIGGAKDSVTVTVVPGVEAMVLWAEKIAADDNFGYSKGTKIYTGNTTADRYCPFCNSGASKDYDCASFVTAAVYHGYGLAAFKSVCKSAPGAGGLMTLLLNNGWKDMGVLSVSQLQRGDILVNPNTHIEIYDGNGYDVGAHQEYDGKTGGLGSLNGHDGKNEISISKTYSFYTSVLRKY